jgi:uncharacterized membrane protein YbjE (DUF340 family)
MFLEKFGYFVTTNQEVGAISRNGWYSLSGIINFMQDNCLLGSSDMAIDM